MHSPEAMSRDERTTNLAGNEDGGPSVADPIRRDRVLRGLRELALREPFDFGPVLALGCRELGYPRGILVRTTQARATVIDVFPPEESALREGGAPLAETGLRRVLDADGPVEFSGELHRGAPLLGGAPSLLLLHSIAVTVAGGDEAWGVLAFGGAESPVEPLGASEYELVSTLGDHLAIRMASAAVPPEGTEVRSGKARGLESLANLAGGLAHELDRHLSSILRSAEMTRRQIGKESLFDEPLRDIEAAALRATELTQQMLAYAGRAHVAAEPMDLGTLVDDMGDVLQTVVSRKTTLSLNAASEPLPIEGDVSQLRQLLANLVANSSDALADRPGAVTVTTGLRFFDRYFLDGIAPAEGLRDGVYAYVEVIDTGVGMDDYTRARIFDPFFTTKFTGRGLGLAVVLGILRSHGGGIRVQSHPGVGTRTTVLFPLAKGLVDPASDLFERVEGGEDAEWEGLGAVLVVDDEEVVRTLMTSVLEDAGFEVFTAQDGEKALQLFEENAAEIRLVLLDMMMPGMSGQQVYATMRDRRPDTSIILMSGFSEEHVTHGLESKDATFLKKPFELSDLIDKVHDLLDS